MKNLIQIGEKIDQNSNPDGIFLFHPCDNYDWIMTIYQNQYLKFKNIQKILKLFF